MEFWTIKVNEDQHTTGPHEMYARMYMIFFPVLTITNISNLEACENQRQETLTVVYWHGISANVDLANMTVAYSKDVLEKSIY